MIYKNRKMIFHYPGIFRKELNTGETKRPVKIYQAFEDLGFEIHRVIGTRPERKEKLKELLPKLHEFDFIYSENSNIPLALCGKHHLPSLKSVDYELFKQAKKEDVPIGVFYRDFYWLYEPFQKELGFLKFNFGLPFYKSEVKLYDKYATNIFLPSERCKSWLPIKDKSKLLELPPGENVNSVSERSDNNSLNLLYVGSIQPPKYDLNMLLKDLSDANKDRNIKLTLITRSDDWEKYSCYYTFPDFVEYHSASGDELAKYYKETDIALYYLTPDPYAAIRLPVKLFEAIGFGIPIISYGDSAVSDFIKENDIGWVVNTEEQQNIFSYILNNREDIQTKEQNVLGIQEKHTWKARAKRVAEVLIGT